MTIQRYWNRHGNIEESEVGAYVLYADHLAAMQRERECREKLVEAASETLSTLRRRLRSEEVCGQPFCGDDEHEAIRLLTAALAAAEELK